MIKRRDRIGRTYLPAINPVVDVALSTSGILTFANAAVDAGFATAPAGGYRARWYAFDNVTRESRPIGSATSAKEGRMQAPELPAVTGSFVRVDIEAVDPPQASWSLPVQAFFRRTLEGWKLVGFDRVAESK